ncbi:hypothetical protein [Peterkaempfera sp. SMS 1(5)a]|uniref:hypothetical protein n=1 Tax=Peterkaempfera podocarpi TaxID=3232308 RepID=UPI00366AF90B
MGDSSKSHARIHRRQSGLAYAALLAALPGLIFGVDTYLAGFFVLTFAPLTVPPFLRRHPSAFTMTCTATGVVLVAWSVVGVLLGMFLFLPSAVLLLLAAAAGPRRSPGVARVLSWAGGLVFAGVVLGSAMWCRHFSVRAAQAEPHTYQAVVDADWERRVGLGQATERLKTFGAVSVWVSSAGGEDKAYLEVRFSEGLSDVDRAELKGRISELPGVGRVDLCPVRDCG